MRLHTGTWREQMEAKQAWRAWFAWYPVKIEGAWVWLETVERGDYGCDEYGGWYSHRFPVNGWGSDNA